MYDWITEGKEILAATGWSNPTLHVVVGLVLYAAARSCLWRRRRAGWWALLVVALFQTANEARDFWDFFVHGKPFGLGFQVVDTLGDYATTLVLPALVLAAELMWMTRRRSRNAGASRNARSRGARR